MIIQFKTEQTKEGDPLTLQVIYHDEDEIVFLSIGTDKEFEEGEDSTVEIDRAIGLQLITLLRAVFD